MGQRIRGQVGLAVWIATLTALAGCSGQAAPPSMSSSQREESEAREVVFCDLLKEVKPGEVCFLAFGMQAGAWIDPPPSFLEQLSIPQVTLRKASEAQFPKWLEMDPENPKRYQGVRDPKTGKRSYVYSVEIDSVTPNRVMITADVYGGPLSGFGYESSVQRVKDRWEIKHDGRSWEY